MVAFIVECYKDAYNVGAKELYIQIERGWFFSYYVVWYNMEERRYRVRTDVRARLRELAREISFYIPGFTYEKNIYPVFIWPPLEHKAMVPLEYVVTIRLLTRPPTRLPPQGILLPSACAN